MNKKLNLRNALFFSLGPILSIPTSIWWFSNHFNANTIYLAIIFYSLIEISITGGYHRYFSHRTYKAHFLVEAFYLIFGAAALQGSALLWSIDHRIHHMHVDDNEKDPYSINKGFWWAHMLWLFYKDDSQKNEKVLGNDLFEDKLVMLQHKTWIPLGFAAGFFLPGAIAHFAWGDFWGGFLIAGLLRSVINHHSTFLINSLSHIAGDQTYSDSHSGRDNWFTAFLTFGEGYHNFHHEFPSDYRNGIRFYDWDPTKWFIKGLSLVGLTSNLKTVREELIMRKKMKMKEKRLIKKMNQKMAKKPFDFESTEFFKLMQSARVKVEETGRQLSDMRNKLNDLQKQLKNGAVVQIEIKTINIEISKLQEQFRKYVSEWNVLSKKAVAQFS